MPDLLLDSSHRSHPREYPKASEAPRTPKQSRALRPLWSSGIPYRWAKIPSASSPTRPPATSDAPHSAHPDDGSPFQKSIGHTGQRLTCPVRPQTDTTSPPRDVPHYPARPLTKPTLNYALLLPPPPVAETVRNDRPTGGTPECDTMV